MICEREILASRKMTITLSLFPSDFFNIKKGSFSIFYDEKINPP
jgi:hypothetical protein